ncbi:MAG: hypothetical protein K1X88_20810 [Nannocystaceae bacterium]|nr:hypothetical protein [Nannocystaceae bacterium]
MTRPGLSLFVSIAFVVACGGDDGEACTDAAQCTATTATASASASASAGSESGSDSGGSGEASGSSDGSTAADASASSVSADSGSSGGDVGTCDPAMAPFVAQAPALPQASLQIDFGAGTCAATSLTGTAPQLTLDVQPSGLLVATGFGIEIQSANIGLVFDDPPMGDSQVIDLEPDIPVTIEATDAAGTAMITIAFTIDAAGPVLADTSVVFH